MEIYLHLAATRHEKADWFMKSRRHRLALENTSLLYIYFKLAATPNPKGRLIFGCLFSAFREILWCFGKVITGVRFRLGIKVGKFIPESGIMLILEESSIGIFMF